MTNETKQDSHWCNYEHGGVYCAFCDAQVVHTNETMKDGDRATIPLAWQNTFDGLLAYVFQDELHNRLTPRVIDIAYTAFMSGACGKNKDDGGPCDWFNDTKPVVEIAIGKIRKELAEARAASPQSGEKATESPEEMMERMTREWAALTPLQQYAIAKGRKQQEAQPDERAAWDNVRFVRDTFKKDIEQGYKTRDKEFAVELLDRAISASQGAKQ
ncbi:hypothetical protein [Paraburkholderia sp. WP4_3_2]|uniref:hypothetical protein n=1 Tax=Paraburkholderia sp. WP4_3_2 TaxID=2587162 RepID=UPI0016140341|nr:hypothetical protein [Paraburkholderia sp. WP4_3_2]MBB3256909.1 hypothetical protein [Paraburkholderia sp. WP4_3_2]